MSDARRQRTGHVPERRCLGCGRRGPKATLLRFVAAPVPGGRALTPDRAGAAPGRGMYICPRRACFERAVERQAFRRAARLGGDRLRIDEGLGAELATDGTGGQ